MPYDLSPPTASATATTRKRVSAIDVEKAADALLRTGERPTIERIRARLGGGSPNTINPLLDSWWRRLGARVDAGPAALARLPDTVAHVAEALWLQALQEARRRAQIELGAQDERANRRDDDLEVRSHVLSLREGELTERLADKEKRIGQLELELRDARLALRKETATVEALRAQVNRAAQPASERVRTKAVVAPRSRKPAAASTRQQRPKRVGRRRRLSGKGLKRGPGRQPRRH